MNRALSGLLLAVAAARSMAAVPASGTDDTAQGMTCHYLLAAANLAWDRAGGDWVDAKGQAHGMHAFAAVQVARSKAPQPVDWDITALARRWVAGDSWPGVVYLRAEPGLGAGTVEFHSRESPDAMGQPRLKLQWSDGKAEQLSPQADAHLACPNFRSAGGAAQLKVSNSQGALVIFAVAPRSGLAIEKATLSMTSNRQTGRGATVGVYGGRRPGGGVSPVEQGLAAALAQDQGIEHHADVWFADRFENLAYTRSWLRDSDSDKLGFAAPSERRLLYEPLDGPALVVTLPAGSTQAMNSHLPLARLAGAEPTEAFFRYYLRLADNWNPTEDGGKLPGLSGTYGQAGWGGRKADGVSGWSARGGFYQQAQAGSAVADRRPIGSYVYHAGMSGNYGDSWGWNLGPTGVLLKNRWYCVEQHVRLNSPGNADGVFRAWIDGQLVFQKNDVRYRDTDALKIESVWMNVYHGGAKPTPREMTIYMDNIVVARRYIGPMGKGQRSKP